MCDVLPCIVGRLVSPQVDAEIAMVWTNILFTVKEPIIMATGGSHY